MTPLDARTPIEERLVAALAARSELVQPELLSQAAPVVPGSRRWRGPALAAAAAVVVAVPTVVVIALTHDDPVAALSSLPGNAGMSFPADVDDDGDSDLIRLADDGTLTIDRGQDGTSVVELPAGSWLLGAAHVGGAAAEAAGQADIVAAVPAEGDSWSVRLISGEGTDLSALLEPSPPRITDTSTAWVDQGVLFTATWEDTAVAGVPLRVEASLIEAGFDSVIRRPAGELCWDRPSQPYPRTCPSGSPAPSPRPELPPMFPAQGLELLRPGDAGWSTPAPRGRGAWRLGLLPRDEGAVLTGQLGDGFVHRTVVPGPDPALVKVNLGAGWALVVHGAAGGQVAEVYALFAEGLAPVPLRGGVPLMSGTAPGGGAYTFWVAEDGVLYSRRTDPDDEQRGEVWQWRTSTQGGDFRLEATSLGTVCVDLASDPVRYGRC